MRQKRRLAIEKNITWVNAELSRQLAEARKERDEALRKKEEYNSEADDEAIINNALRAQVEKLKEQLANMKSALLSSRSNY